MERIKKYKAKIDGDVSKIRIDRYGAEQATHFKGAVAEQAKIEIEVKRMMKDYNISAMFTHFYTNFGKKCVQLRNRFGGDNLCTELDAATNAWEGRGLNRNLLCDIRAYYVSSCPCVGAPPACDWSYKMKLTFTGNISATDLDDFPVLIHLTSLNFNFSHAKTNGEDIRFMDSDTCPSGETPLKHEIEDWDQAGQDAWVWVKVPRINGGSVDDFIYMFFGNPAAADAQDPPNVWDDSFRMVQHKYDNPDNITITGSTVYGHVGTKVGANKPIEAGTQIWRGQQYNNVDEWITIPHDVCLDFNEAITIEAWVYWGGDAGEDAVIARWTPPIQVFVTTIGFVSDKWRLAFRDAGYAQRACDSTSNVPHNTWTYLVAVWDNPYIRLYINGVQDKECLIGDVNLNITNAIVCIGDVYVAGSPIIPYGGKMDEARISSNARTPDWIMGQFRSMKELLITYGAEEGT